MRIDEGALQLHALTPRGEARVALHPDTRPGRFLMRVREALAGHAMGSPGGYPVHLRCWTRRGHASPKNLAALLCLGEPEAVTAVSLSAALTDELAHRAWWAQPTDDVARAMLGQAAVGRGRMGPVRAQHLLEHLPFEQDRDAAIASVAAVAAAGLLDEAARERLWRAARSRPHYLIGWLAHAPDTLPPAPPRVLPAALAEAAARGDAAAALLRDWASAAGQGYLRTLEMVLEKLPTHGTVYRVLDLVVARFAPARAVPGERAPARAGEEARLADPAGARGPHGEPAGTAPPGHGALGVTWDAREALVALRGLAATDPAAAAAILRRTSAVGPLMRRHLAPVLEPLLRQVRRLREMGAPA